MSAQPADSSQTNNASVGHADARFDPSHGIEARLNGVARRLTERVLAGRGWTVAGMTTPGGLGAFLAGSTARYTDRIVSLEMAIRVDETTLVARIRWHVGSPRSHGSPN